MAACSEEERKVLQLLRVFDSLQIAGQRTALVEQQRPNLFTTAVANIPPGAEITVEIAYQHMLDWREDRFSLRVPMAITPRYAGGKASPGAEEAAAPAGWPLLPGELRNTATFGAAQDARSAVDLEVQLQPGFELAELRSHYHSVTREQTEGGMRIRLDPGATADRDFDSWRTQCGSLLPRRRIPQAAPCEKTHRGNGIRVGL